MHAARSRRHAELAPAHLRQPRHASAQHRLLRLRETHPQPASTGFGIGHPLCTGIDRRACLQRHLREARRIHLPGGSHPEIGTP